MARSKVKGSLSRKVPKVNKGTSRIDPKIPKRNEMPWSLSVTATVVGRKAIIGRQCPKQGESSTPSNLVVQWLPTYVHLDVLNDEPYPLSAMVKTILTIQGSGCLTLVLQITWLLLHIVWPIFDLILAKSTLEIIPPFLFTVKVLWSFFRMEKEDIFPPVCSMYHILYFTSCQSLSFASWGWGWFFMNTRYQSRRKL